MGGAKKRRGGSYLYSEIFQKAPPHPEAQLELKMGEGERGPQKGKARFPKSNLSSPVRGTPGEGGKKSQKKKGGGKFHLSNELWLLRACGCSYYVKKGREKKRSEKGEKTARPDDD